MHIHDYHQPSPNDCLGRKTITHDDQLTLRTSVALEPYELFAPKDEPCTPAIMRSSIGHDAALPLPDDEPDCKCDLSGDDQPCLRMRCSIGHDAALPLPDDEPDCEPVSRLSFPALPIEPVVGRTTLELAGDQTAKADAGPPSRLSVDKGLDLTAGWSAAFSSPGTANIAFNPAMLRDSLEVYQHLIKTADGPLTTAKRPLKAAHHPAEPSALPGSGSWTPRSVLGWALGLLLWLGLGLALLCGLDSGSPEMVSRLADQQIAALDQLAHGHGLLKHPFLLRMERAEFTDQQHALQTFAREHFVYSRHFINYLETVANKITDRATREPIVENMLEENGNYEPADLAVLAEHGVQPEWVDKIPHKYLMHRFVNATGLNSVQLLGEGVTDSPGGRFTRFVLDLYAESSACEGLAILGFAIEETVSGIYQHIWDGLKLSTIEPREYAFFPLHIVVDDGHADLLKASFKSFLTSDQAASCSGAAAAVQRVLDARVRFFDEMLEMCDAVPAAAAQEEASPAVEDDSISQADAIAAAKKRTLESLAHPQYTPQQKMALSARILYAAGHSDSLAGQVSCLEPQADGSFGMMTMKYGHGFDEAQPGDMISVDQNLQTVKGEGFPNFATRFHVHIYKARPDIQCIVHTHSPAVNALGLLGQPLMVNHMDVIGLYDQVGFAAQWPGVPFGDEEGEFMVRHLGEQNNAAILAHHGGIAVGKTIEEATYRAYFLEQAAKLHLAAAAAMKTGQELPQVDPELATTARDWRTSAGPVNAHFHYWARRVLRDSGKLASPSEGSAVGSTVGAKVGSLVH